MGTLAKIFRKSSPPTVPPRVPVREIVQEKLKGENQEISQIKSEFQLKTVTNEEPLMTSIVEIYPEELQPVNPEKNLSLFRPTISKNLTVTPKNEK